MAKICYILRGLSGTGKSQLAKNLRDSHIHARVFSTDRFFMVDGEYQFDPTKLGEYHAQNLRQATYFMEGCSSVYDYSDALCIIDNTNTFISIDWKREDIPLYAERNSHGVPEEAIYRMAERWE
jgi:NEDD4-binding protein 2